MAFVLYGWLLFRARSMDQIVTLTTGLANFTVPTYLQSYLANLLAYTLPVVVFEVWQARNEKRTTPLVLPWPVKSALQGALVLGILFFWMKVAAPFLYFQF